MEDNALVLTVQQQHDNAADIESVIGKRVLSTKLRHNVIAREKNVLAALEVVSRFPANPQWLIIVSLHCLCSSCSRGHDIRSL
jgi:protein phosphatase